MRLTTSDPNTAYGTTVAVTGALMVLVLVGWAASIGSDAVLSGDGPRRSQQTLSPSSGTADTDPPGPSPREGEGRASSDESTETPLMVKAIPYAFMAVALVCLTVMLWMLHQMRSNRGRSLIRRRDEAEFASLGERDAPGMAETFVEGGPAQRRLLLDATPRNGIVECWERFENQAAGAGARREPWETSTEFVERLLGGVGADADAVHGLAAAFRSARFSGHPVTEEDRAEAIRHLDRIHRSLSGRMTGTSR